MRSALSWGGAGAALKAGDIIHSVNNPPVTTLEQLRTAIAAIKPGHAVVVQVERDGALVGTLSRVTINVGVTRRMLVSIDTASCASAALRRTWEPAVSERSCSGIFVVGEPRT